MRTSQTDKCDFCSCGKWDHDLELKSLQLPAPKHSDFAFHDHFLAPERTWTHIYGASEVWLSQCRQNGWGLTNYLSFLPISFWL